MNDSDRYQANLKDELDGAALYAALAAAERDPVRKDLFLQLSRAEAEHAETWRNKLAAGMTGVAWSLAASALALAAIGLATSLFSGRPPAYSALRQVLIGAAAAGITCATGR
jgi:hypothetical protein